MPPQPAATGPAHSTRPASRPTAAMAKHAIPCSSCATRLPGSSCSPASVRPLQSVRGCCQLAAAIMQQLPDAAPACLPCSHLFASRALTLADKDGYRCGPGLSCEPAFKRCYPSPRQVRKTSCLTRHENTSAEPDRGPLHMLLQWQSSTANSCRHATCRFLVQEKQPCTKHSDCGRCALAPGVDGSL